MIPLYKPYMPELPELDSILHSSILTYGEYSKRFEELLKGYFGTNNLITVSSYNLAISVVILTLGLEEKDEIIASPMACLASTQPFVSSGMKIVWADIDNHSGTLDPDSVRSKITSKTKCIIHNHFCGYPGYIDEINAIGKEYGVTVIDDGIECFGSEYKGDKIGNGASDITIFSFTPIRIPNTIEGGAVIFKSNTLYEKSCLVRDCGINRANFRDNLGEINPLCNIELKGYSAMMSNVNGYIGCKQMESVEKLISIQRKQAVKWIEYLNEFDCKPIITNEANPNYWVFGVLVKDKIKTIQRFRNRGYYASGVHINNDIYSVFGKYSQLCGVEDFNKHFVALPCGWWMA